MIRPATLADLPEILRVYAAARAFMAAHGNPTQWAGGYPAEDLLRQDIAAGRLYVVADEAGGIHGVFALMEGADPTYQVIEGGAWHADTPYATLHRVAGDGQAKGVFAQAVAFARAGHDHLRVDTHQDNLPMQGAIGKQGFRYCGIIHLENGDPRLAYDWLAAAKSSEA